MFKHLIMLCLVLAGLQVYTQIHFLDAVSNKHILADITGSKIQLKDSILNLPESITYPLEVKVTAESYKVIKLYITQKPDSIRNIYLSKQEYLLKSTDIITIRNERIGTSWLNPIDDNVIYAGKKTSLIQPDFIAANKATNNARQIFAKVAGIHIWESDGAGLQMGIGGRGLSPNRNSNFNTRQNGYDIAADPLGYPESYYTPPVEFVERIIIIRGASSLQYGTQFGGLLNFNLKKGSAESRMKITHRSTGGSWFLYNGFTSISGGTSKFSYYTSYQYKRGNNKRPNNTFQSHTTYTSLIWTPNRKWKLTADYTHMSYLAQQAGGLTDAQFEQNPWQSFRSRNWFKVWWNVISLHADYSINERNSFQLKTFGLIASRDAVGILTRINEIDRGQERDLLKDFYTNIGSELKYTHRYPLLSNYSNFLTGIRFFKGRTQREQGFANTETSADFSFLDPKKPGLSDFTFPNLNLAWFAENVFLFPKNIRVIPGIRVEYIRTLAKGNYTLTTKDLAGNIVSDTTINEHLNRARAVYLAGVGMSWKPAEQLEVYGNFTQNYRSITFSDLRISNVNLKVDPAIQDEKGYTADIGMRGKWNSYITYDGSLFFMNYNNRIGTILKNDNVSPFLPYRYRTNIGRAVSTGIELFAETDLLKWFSNHNSNYSLNFFINASYTYARYVSSQDVSVVGKEVEYVPPFMYRSGLEFKVFKGLISLQGSYVSRQFSDATNAIRSSTAVNGIIPGYYVLDLSTKYTYKWLTFEAGINNLTNNTYFTRRAESYPGPGIIPSDPLHFYLGIEFSMNVLKPKSNPKNIEVEIIDVGTDIQLH